MIQRDSKMNVWSHLTFESIRLCSISLPLFTSANHVSNSELCVLKSTWNGFWVNTAVGLLVYSSVPVASFRRNWMYELQQFTCILVMWNELSIPVFLVRNEAKPRLLTNCHLKQSLSQRQPISCDLLRLDQSWAAKSLQDFLYHWSCFHIM